MARDPDFTVRIVDENGDPDRTVAVIDGITDLNPSDGDTLVWDAAAGQWVSAPANEGVTDHGDLDGLGDDDHAQYALADGSRGAFEAAGAAAAHSADSTDVHGIPDTSLLVEASDLDAYQALSEKGANNGYASLDSGGDVPLSELGNVPAGGMTLIEEKVLGAAATTLVFGSIPATYRHLLIEVHGRSDAPSTSWDFLNLRFNADSGGNYNDRHIRGTGATPSSASRTGQTSGRAGTIAGATATAGFADASRIHIPNYKGTTFHHAYLGEAVSTQTGTLEVFTFGGKWASAAAITSVTLLVESGGDFLTGTVASLYGLA